MVSLQMFIWWFSNFTNYQFNSLIEHMDAYFFEYLTRVMIVFNIKWQPLRIAYIIYVMFWIDITISFELNLELKIIGF